MIAALALMAGLAACDTSFARRDTVDARCRCPEGTVHTLVPTSPARAREAYYPSAEEFCRKRGTWTRHGHYVLWGPNGERLEEGEYVDGKREGSWQFWLPSQLQIRHFVGGKQAGVEVRGAPSAFAIDVCACRHQWMGVPLELGSMYWKTVASDDTTCTLEVGGEIEMGRMPLRRYRVPRSLGRVEIPVRDGWLRFDAVSRYLLPDPAPGAPAAGARLIDR